MIISGPSQSGKSFFIQKLLQYQDHVYNTDFERIVLALPAKDIQNHQQYITKVRELVPKIEIVHGMPDITSLRLDFDPDSAKVWQCNLKLL